MFWLKLLCMIWPTMVASWPLSAYGASGFPVPFDSIIYREVWRSVEGMWGSSEGTWSCCCLSPCARFFITPLWAQIFSSVKWKCWIKWVHNVSSLCLMAWVLGFICPITHCQTSGNSFDLSKPKPLIYCWPATAQSQSVN